MGIKIDRLMAVVPTINRLRAVCHEHDTPVFFSRMAFNADYSDSGILLEEPPASTLKSLNGFVRGTWDADIVDELTPTKAETVIDKTRNSAFWATNLEEILGQRGIKHLIVVGVGTNVCVESTARDAFTNGVFTTTISDATGCLSDEEQAGSMRNLVWFGGTATVAEVEEALNAR